VKINSYKDLIVWQKSRKLVVEIYKLTKSFPKSEIYGLTNQIRRSAVSIPSNIAEGYCRQTRKEYIQFLYISYGSSAELETQLLSSFDVGYVTEKQLSEILELLLEVQKMLNVLIKKLK